MATKKRKVCGKPDNRDTSNPDSLGRRALILSRAV
jgi:hypothetical protein